MNDIGKKIREERLRLGLTQEEFARACNVGRRAQSSYEAGERVPDLDYLKCAINAGADPQYILIGVRREASATADHFKDRFIRALCEYLQINGGAIDDALHALNKAVSDGVTHDLNSFGLNRIADGLLLHSQRLNATEVQLELNSEVLSDIIRGVEARLMHEQYVIPPHAKALALVSLYRFAATSGQIDEEMLNWTVANLLRTYGSR